MSEENLGASPPPPPPPSGPPVVVRRGRASERFVARAPVPPPAGVVVSRGVLGSRSSTKPQTSRERRIAGDLPDWEPLPPGELLVTRPHS